MITQESPGSVETVTQPGEVIVQTITVEGQLTTVTITQQQPGVVTALRGSVTTTTEFVVPSCPAPTPTPAPTAQLQNSSTWGCPPGYFCAPPKPAGCVVFEGPPPDNYVCQPSECVIAPKFTPVTWGTPIYSNDTSFYPLQPPYFNLDPQEFGLSFGIFAEEVITTTITDAYGHEFTTVFSTGDWASQATITAQPTDVYSALPARRALRRALFRRASPFPAMCYDDCNNPYLEAQAVGKTAALCATGSDFETGIQTCKDCIATHSSSTQQSLQQDSPSEFTQFTGYCDALNAQAANEPSVVPSPTPVESNTPTVVVNSASQAPAPTSVAPQPISVSSTTTSAAPPPPPPPPPPAPSSSSSSTPPPPPVASLPSSSLTSTTQPAPAASTTIVSTSISSSSSSTTSNTSTSTTSLRPAIASTAGVPASRPTGMSDLILAAGVAALVGYVL